MTYNIGKNQGVLQESDKGSFKVKITLFSVTVVFSMEKKSIESHIILFLFYLCLLPIIQREKYLM